MKLIVDKAEWQFPDRWSMTDDEFFEFASQMDEKRIERDKHGNILIMPPVGGNTGEYELNAAFYVKQWALKNGGRVFGSNTGFTLPNNAVRSPDAAWISDDHYAQVPNNLRKKFPPICPDFVIEIRSTSDTLKPIHEKMAEYMENGSRLGFLIDPVQQKAWVYRPNHATELVEDFSGILSGENVLPGFELPLSAFKELSD
jgi:Uma2 family endonuclease